MSITAGSTSITFNDGWAQSASAPKIRVNFNGTGGAGANQTINASQNVSSVYKNGTGDYTVNFSITLADSAFSPVAGSEDNARDMIIGTMATTSFRFTLGNYAVGSIDRTMICCTLFR